MSFSFVDTIFDPLTRKKVKRWVLELPGAGCEWYKKCGGCTMCGFNQEAAKFTFGGKMYPHWIFMLIFYYAYILVRRQQPELLVIYNAGSYLSNKEIPFRTQLAILRFAGRNKHIKKVLVETRAEFVTKEKMTLYKEAVGEIELEIAFGLESVDNHARNSCLRKGMRLQVFEKALEICQNIGIQTFAYVFLKPSCFNEREAIEDAVRTISYCFDKGADEVSLSCAFIQRDTKLATLYEQGDFTPPRLWSIIEVIKRTRNLGPVRIGSFDDTPPPIAKPSNNCPLCEETVMSAIEKYRQTHDHSLFEGFTCECQ